MKCYVIFGEQGYKMSRIGKEPIPIPPKVEVKIDQASVQITGPKGELTQSVRSGLDIRQDDGAVLVERSSDAPELRALHGTIRMLINNMIVGVTDGWNKELQIEGVGYRAELQGNELVLSLGYSHPVKVAAPSGIEFEVDGSSRNVIVKGADKQLVGQIAANVRSLRPPEPYKGKGIRYKGEYVRRKAGKAGKVE